MFCDFDHRVYQGSIRDCRWRRGRGHHDIVTDRNLNGRCLSACIAVHMKLHQTEPDNDQRSANKKQHLQRLVVAQHERIHKRRERNAKQNRRRHKKRRGNNDAQIDEQASEHGTRGCAANRKDLRRLRGPLKSLDPSHVEDDKERPEENS